MLKPVLSDLESWGCDVQGALERMVNDQDMYIDLLTQYVPSIDLEELDELVAKKESPAAFDYVHEMKGVVGNLGLSPLYKPVCKITEILRSNSFDGLESPLAELRNAKKELVGILKESCL